MLIISARREERNSSSFFLSRYAMLDRFKKLVAVAEEMATKRHNAGESVEGIDVQVEGSQGVVRVGVYAVVGVTFSSDDNVHFPEYGVDYWNYYYDWRGEGWVEHQPLVQTEAVGFCEEADDLPF